MIYLVYLLTVYVGCRCNILGTKGHSKSCSAEGQCDCQEGYSGNKCTEWSSGYHKNNGYCQTKSKFNLM